MITQMMPILALTLSKDISSDLEILFKIPKIIKLIYYSKTRLILGSMCAIFDMQ